MSLFITFVLGVMFGLWMRYTNKRINALKLETRDIWAILRNEKGKRCESSASASGQGK